MTTKTILPLLALAAASAVPAMAQTSMGQPPARYGTNTTTTQNGRGKQPCWQVAGVSQSAMEQERALYESARSQMESVCHNTSMTPQQKHEEMRKIEESVHQRMGSIISPQQQSAMKSCRASRGEGGHMGGGGMHGGGMHQEMERCGEMPGRGTGTGTGAGTGTGNGTGMPAPTPGVHN